MVSDAPPRLVVTPLVLMRFTKLLSARDILVFSKASGTQIPAEQENLWKEKLSGNNQNGQLLNMQVDWRVAAVENAAFISADKVGRHQLMMDDIRRKTHSVEGSMVSCIKLYEVSCTV